MLLRQSRLGVYSRPTLIVEQCILWPYDMYYSQRTKNYVLCVPEMLSVFSVIVFLKAKERRNRFMIARTPLLQLRWRYIYCVHLIDSCNQQMTISDQMFTSQRT